MKAEMARLAAEGVKYIQIDAPRYSYFMDPKWREWIRTEMKVEPEAWFEESIRADNACFEAARRPGRDAGNSSLPRATARATGMPKAATTPSPKRCSGRWPWTDFCWSTTTAARERLSRCGLFRATRLRCSGWSVRSVRSWRMRRRAGRADQGGGEISAARKPHAQPAMRFRFGDAREFDNRRPAVG